MASRIVRQDSSAPTKVHAAIYARVSTLNGAQDPTMQTRELEEYCQRRGWRVFDCYVDKGVSGKKDSRPQLNRMMQDAHERRFDVVVVWRFDRFARSVSHLLRALETLIHSACNSFLCQSKLTPVPLWERWYSRSLVRLRNWSGT
jgi:DNA invertase Pin-like site-specific DNA recombinase